MYARRGHPHGGTRPNERSQVVGFDAGHAGVSRREDALERLGTGDEDLRHAATVREATTVRQGADATLWTAAGDGGTVGTTAEICAQIRLAPRRHGISAESCQSLCTDLGGGAGG
jgi:hypothetical protein